MAADLECPDGATCHHRCLSGCFRVSQGHAPLNSAGMGDAWPSSVRRSYGTVVQDGLPDPSPEPPTSGGHEPPLSRPGHVSSGSSSGEAPPPATTSETIGIPAVPGFVAPPMALEPASVPVVDLTGLVSNLGGSVLNLRAQAVILRKAAERLEAEADQLRMLRDTLNGDHR